MEKIEDEYDLECYKKAINEYKKNPKTYTLDEVKEELGLQMKYKILFTDKAKKQLKKLDKHISALIIGWLEKNIENTENPRVHGKGLVENKSGQWRYRIGDYRVICEIQDENVIVLVLEIGHRKEIYNKQKQQKSLNI